MTTTKVLDSGESHSVPGGHLNMTWFSTVCFALGLLAGLVSSAPSVSLRRGVLTGVDEEAQGTRTPLHVYYGIPFAQPPLGSLRFQPPRPFLATDPSQVINSRSFRSACIQDASITPIPQSEDCLYLNVYTPSVGSDDSFDPNNGKKVMVWIHGGGFVYGDAINYRPTRLVTDYDVIVVTIQYRLGIMGFLSSGDEALPGNLGLRDQILALQWVKANIGQFGGNPNDVTIFGESAGGASVSILGLSPLTNGLFTKSIMQSGVALNPWATDPKPSRTFYEVAKKANCLPLFYFPAFKSLDLAYNKRIVTCLQRLGARQLFNVTVSQEQAKDMEMFMAQTYYEQALIFVPVIDGELLPRDPSFLMNDPNYLARIGALNRKYIIGFNNNENAGFADMILANKELRDRLANVDDDLTRRFVKENIQPAFRFPVTSDLLNFASLVYLYPRDSQYKVDIQGLIDLSSDVTFVIPAIRMAQALVKASSSLDVFFYMMDHYPVMAKGPDVSLPGSGHALDLAYIFDDNPEIRSFFSSYGNLYTQSDLPLLDVFRGSLTNMAKSGNPSRPGAAQWPRYDLPNESYMALSPTPEVRQRVFKRRVSFWTDFLPRVVGAIFESGPGRMPFRV